MWEAIRKASEAVGSASSCVREPASHEEHHENLKHVDDDNQAAQHARVHGHAVRRRRALDEAALRLFVERYRRAGVGAFLGTSSPGEGFALTLDETERLYAVAKEAMAGRAPVRAMGVEPHNAGRDPRPPQVAESVGLDAMQLYCLDCSHGNRPTDVELEASSAPSSSGCRSRRCCPPISCSAT